MLNNTLLDATPVGLLNPNTRYRYQLASVEEASSGIEKTFSHVVDFRTETNTADVFDINAISLDNNNYANNGVLIRPTNTARISTSTSVGNGSTYLVLPLAIENLSAFTIGKQLVVRNGTASNPLRSYTLVENVNNSSGGYDPVQHGGPFHCKCPWKF